MPVGVVGYIILRAECEARSEVLLTNKSEYEEWPAGRGEAFEKRAYIYKLFLRLIRGLHRMAGPFNKSCVHPDLAHSDG